MYKLHPTQSKTFIFRGAEVYMLFCSMVLGNGQQQLGIFKKKHAALAIWRSNLDIAQVLCKVFW